MKHLFLVVPVLLWCLGSITTDHTVESSYVMAIHSNVIERVDQKHVGGVGKVSTVQRAFHEVPAVGTATRNGFYAVHQRVVMWISGR